MVVGAYTCVSCLTAAIVVTCHEQAVVTASGGLRGPKSFKLKEIVDSALEMAAEQGHVVMRSACNTVLLILLYLICLTVHTT